MHGEMIKMAVTWCSYWKKIATWVSTLCIHNHLDTGCYATGVVGRALLQNAIIRRCTRCKYTVYSNAWFHISLEVLHRDLVNDLPRENDSEVLQKGKLRIVLADTRDVRVTPNEQRRTCTSAVIQWSKLLFVLYRYWNSKLILQAGHHVSFW